MPMFSPSPATFERLLRHLVNLEDQSIHREEWGVEEPSLGAYIQRLDDLVRKARVLAGGSNLLPFVVVGSVVELEVRGRSGLYWTRVVPALDVDERAGRISYLSPAGRALLLKGVGDEAHLPWERGVCHCTVRGIFLPGEILHEATDGAAPWG